MPAWSTFQALTVDVSLFKEIAISYCYANDLLILKEDNSEKVHAPMTLCPYPFPYAAFQDSPCFNLDFNLLSLNLPSHPLYRDLLERVKWVDSFVNDLYACANHESRFEFGVLRSDYLEEETSAALKQVELNTVSVSLFGLSPKVTGFHGLRHKDVRENDALNVISEAFRQANELYKQTYMSAKGLPS